MIASSSNFLFKYNVIQIPLQLMRVLAHGALSFILNSEDWFHFLYLCRLDFDY